MLVVWAFHFYSFPRVRIVVGVWVQARDVVQPALWHVEPVVPAGRSVDCAGDPTVTDVPQLIGGCQVRPALAQLRRSLVCVPRCGRSGVWNVATRPRDVVSLTLPWTARVNGVLPPAMGLVIVDRQCRLDAASAAAGEPVGWPAAAPGRGPSLGRCEDSRNFRCGRHPCSNSRDVQRCCGGIKRPLPPRGPGRHDHQPGVGHNHDVGSIPVDF